MFKFTGFLPALLFFACVCLPSAQANTELDRAYSLETVGYIRAWDNVDGLFADYVSQAYQEYFAGDPRFVLQDLSKADVVLSKSKLPYSKVIEDPKVLTQIARSTRTQTLLRTKIRKEGPEYRFTVDWLHAPQMELIASDQFTLKEGPELENLKGALMKSLSRIIGGLPFVGRVTGRDAQSVTVNIGSRARVRPGDELEIGTLDEVKRHPLLHTIVDWRMSTTGKLTVEQVEDAIAFCHVLEEDSAHPIMKNQKVIQVLEPPKPKPSPRLEAEEAPPAEPAEEIPRLGYIGASLGLGSFNRDYSLTSGKGKTGSGSLLEGGAESRIWMTGSFFGELGLKYGTWSYKQSDLSTPDTSTALGSGNLSSFRVAAGYAFLGSDSLFGTKGWARLGYRSDSANLPTSSADDLGSASFKTVFLGVGGQIPLRSNFGAELNFDFGLLNSVSESGFSSGNSNGATDFEFSLAPYYRFSPKLTLKLEVDYTAESTSFDSGNSLSHKIIAIAPAILYYF